MEEMELELENETKKEMVCEDRDHHRERSSLDGFVPPAMISPAFLRSNATSHEFPFSAIAELLDNANDPDVEANRVNIEHRSIGGFDCLVVADDGHGMTRDALHRMLSFGFSDKQDIGLHKAIGRYGNGFKSGSMRLGRDALVLTKEMDTRTMSVGFLSQTFLEAVQIENVLVPMATWDLDDPSGFKFGADERCLELILQYSLIGEKEDLMRMLRDIPEFRTVESSGTTIIIYNMSLKEENGEVVEREELQFDVQGKADVIWRGAPVDAPDMQRSLRKYLQFLYKVPRMKIVLLGKLIRSRHFSTDLTRQKNILYTRNGQEGINILMGFHKKKLDVGSQDYGVLFYHKNRLIKAFVKLGYQKQSNDKGHGVVAVVEADYLEPIHNKQEFNKDDNYNNLCCNVANAINDYWDALFMDGDGNIQQINADTEELVDWVKCDKCKKFRRLPSGHKLEDETADWFCSMHPDELSCEHPAHEMEDTEREVLSRSAVRQSRKRKNRFRIAEKEEELIKETTKKVKQEEAERTRERSLGFIQRTGLLLMRMNMNLASNFGNLPVSVKEVVEELHRENGGGAGKNLPFLQCSQCMEWRKVESSPHSSTQWKCQDGSFQCRTTECADPPRDTSQDCAAVLPMLLKKQQSEDEQNLASADSNLNPAGLVDLSVEDEVLSEKEQAMHEEIREVCRLNHLILSAMLRETRVKEEQMDESEKRAEIERLQKELEEKNARLASCRCSPSERKQEKSERELELEREVRKMIQKMIPFRVDEQADVLEVVKAISGSRYLPPIASRESPSPTCSE